VAFDDHAVADWFDSRIDAGQKPEEFFRIWIHTHPGHCPRPSSTDEETFARVFGRADWAVMFILACGGDTYARLRFNHGPGGDLELAVGVDFTRPFASSDHDAWSREYRTHVKPEEVGPRIKTGLAWPRLRRTVEEPNVPWQEDWPEKSLPGHELEDEWLI
jgi:hypothetical protein